jgi:uncharacterized Fe-S center protein
MDINKLLKLTNMYAKTDWKKYFHEESSPAVKEYLETNADRIYPWILTILKQAVDENLDEVAIIKFTDTKMFATIQKNEYTDLLNKIMEHFIEKEEYEKCIEIRDLITTLSIPTTKPKRKYTKKNKLNK